jgi:hypothetical protein
MIDSFSCRTVGTLAAAEAVVEGGCGAASCRVEDKPALKMCANAVRFPGEKTPRGSLRPKRNKQEEIL